LAGNDVAALGRREQRILNLPAGFYFGTVLFRGPTWPGVPIESDQFWAHPSGPGGRGSALAFPETLQVCAPFVEAKLAKFWTAGHAGSLSEFPRKFPPGARFPFAQETLTGE